MQDEQAVVKPRVQLPQAETNESARILTRAQLQRQQQEQQQSQYQLRRSKSTQQQPQEEVQEQHETEDFDDQQRGMLDSNLCWWQQSLHALRSD